MSTTISKSTILLFINTTISMVSILMSINIVLILINVPVPRQKRIQIIIINNPILININLTHYILVNIPSNIPTYKLPKLLNRTLIITINHIQQLVLVHTMFLHILNQFLSQQLNPHLTITFLLYQAQKIVIIDHPFTIFLKSNNKPFQLLLINITKNLHDLVHQKGLVHLASHLHIHPVQCLLQFHIIIVVSVQLINKLLVLLDLIFINILKIILHFISNHLIIHLLLTLQYNLSNLIILIFCQTTVQFPKTSCNLLITVHSQP